MVEFCVSVGAGVVQVGACGVSGGVGANVGFGVVCVAVGFGVVGVAISVGMSSGAGIFINMSVGVVCQC